MLITYSGNGEFLVCEQEAEAQMLTDYFIEGDRDLEDYDREIFEGYVSISSQVKLTGFDRVISNGV